MRVINKILNYKDLKIYQETEMFAYTLDSVLLARFYKPKKPEIKLCDFGTNNGIIPLIVSNYVSKDSRIIGVEINYEACKIAKMNIELNKKDNAIKIIHDDIKLFVKEKNNYFDVVYCNPPFFRFKELSKLNSKKEKLIGARHEIFITLEEIIIAAKIALKNKGKFIMIHLVERMDEIVHLLTNNNFRINRLQVVYSKNNQDAKKVLIEAVNDGNWGMKFLKPLIIHNDDGTYTKEIEEWFCD